MSRHTFLQCQCMWMELYFEWFGPIPSAFGLHWAEPRMEYCGPSGLFAGPNHYHFCLWAGLAQKYSGPKAVVGWWKVELRYWEYFDQSYLAPKTVIFQLGYL